MRTSKITWLLLLVYIELSFATIDNKTKKAKRHVLSALDCRSPKSVHTGLLKEVCGTSVNKTSGEKEKEQVTILQRSPIRVLKGLRCSKTVTRLQVYCGSFSHMKFFEPPSISKIEAFPLQKCIDANTNSLYVTEDQRTISLRKNHRVEYKYYSHGNIHSTATNVECQGDEVNIMGAQHKGVITLVTSQILAEEIQIEIDLDSDKVVDLDLQVALPFECSKDM